MTKNLKVYQETNNLKVYHLGQNTTYPSISELITNLIKRDYPYLDTFDGTNTLQIFIPEVNLIKHPKIISESAYLRLKNALEVHDAKTLKEFEGKYMELKGHIVENLCYDDIKEYFHQRNETVLVIHGLCMLNPDPKKGQNGSEKDFIIVNYTYNYIMAIEVKSSLTTNVAQNAKLCPVEKSVNQLKEAFEILEELFGEDIKGSWWFIPMIYCSTMDKKARNILKSMSDLIFCRSGDKSFAYKMDILAHRCFLSIRKDQGLRKPEIFKTLARHLIFAVSSIEIPVKGSIINKIRKFREEAGSYENILLWLFLNPAQLTIMNCEASGKVILTGTYSVGKTTILIARALKLNDKGEKVLFVNATGIRDKEIVKTLMSLQLEEQFKDKPKITFKTFSNMTILTELSKAKKSYYKNHHLIIDEYILQTKDKKATEEEIHETRQLFENLAKRFKSVWICLSRGYLSTSLFDNDFEANFDLIESWFPGWFVPKLRYPLRGSAEIVKFVKHNNQPYLKKLTEDDKEIQLPSLHLGNLEIPQNLIRAYKPELFVGKEVKKMVEKLDFSPVFEKLGSEHNFLIIMDDSLYDHLLDGLIKRPKMPLRYNLLMKDDENEVKKWIKGDRNCDMITDIFHAAGFEAEFVIVFGNRTSLSAASRATTKLAVVEINQSIRKNLSELNKVTKVSPEDLHFKLLGQETERPHHLRLRLQFEMWTYFARINPLKSMAPSFLPTFVNRKVKTEAKKSDTNLAKDIGRAFLLAPLQDGTKVDDNSQFRNDQKTNDSEELKESKPTRENKGKGKGKKSKRYL